MGDVEHSFEPTLRRVRTRFGGVDFADTRCALLMMGGYRPPLYELSNYYFPRKDVRGGLLVPSGYRSHYATRGEATHWTLRVGEREAVDDAWSYESPPAGWEGIRGYVAFTWNSMDAWFEEDEEVFVHPRDPHHRVDVLRPCLLFETGMPTRYYLPRADVLETEVDGVVEVPPLTKWTAGIPDRDLV